MTVKGGLITGGGSTNGSGGFDMKSETTLILNKATVAGCRAQEMTFWNTDGYGGNFLYGGFCYTLNFRSLEEAVRFLENLVPVDPRGSEKPASLHKA